MFKLQWGEKGNAKTPYALVVKWFMRIYSVINDIGVFFGYWFVCRIMELQYRFRLKRDVYIFLWNLGRIFA
jgi:hypothetical protein